MKINDVVKIKDNWHSEIWEKYWKGNLYEKRGWIVEIIGYNGKIEGYRVKFPVISIPDENGNGKEIENFVWAFRPNEIELVDEKIKSRSKRVYRTGMLLQRRRKAVGEMKQRGMKIKDIAKQIEIPEGTIKRWLHLARNKEKVRLGVL